MNEVRNFVNGEQLPLSESIIKEKITPKEIREMMDLKLFIPTNEHELEKICDFYYQWTAYANSEDNRGKVSTAIEICITVLDEIGRRFEADEYYKYNDDKCLIDNVCLEGAGVLTEIMSSSETKKSLKNQVLRKLNDVTRHSSFFDYGYFEIDEFIENGGIYDENIGW